MEHSLRSFPFFRRERKRTERSVGSHKSPKTREITEHSFFRTEKNVTYHTEKNGKEQSAQPSIQEIGDKKHTRNRRQEKRVKR